MTLAVGSQLTQAFASCQGPPWPWVVSFMVPNQRPRERTCPQGFLFPGWWEVLMSRQWYDQSPSSQALGMVATEMREESGKHLGGLGAGG